MINKNCVQTRAFCAQFFIFFFVIKENALGGVSKNFSRFLLDRSPSSIESFDRRFILATFASTPREFHRPIARRRLLFIIIIFFFIIPRENSSSSLVQSFN